MCGLPRKSYGFAEFANESRNDELCGFFRFGVAKSRNEGEAGLLGRFVESSRDGGVK